MLALRPAAETATAKPEEVGLSSERLGRITEMMKRHIAAGEIAAASRWWRGTGKIAHLEAHGVIDIESKKPMTKDAVFRIASMTKPVTGVAIMMMMEEGKLRITDPVSKFIPSFKDMKVAVASPRAGPAARRRRRAGRAAKVLHGARRARDHDSRPAHAHLGPRERPDEQQRHPRPRSPASRPTRWLTTFPGSA